jgi:carbon monoxide dehydrogenase subunit G
LRVAPESVGWPLDQTRVRIVDGEICVSGAQVMRGYLDDPQATKAVLRDGWLHTGDSGELDPQGRLRVRDRRVDLIVSGGENVYPAEVEAALLRHPDVAEACVIGRPDPEWGQCVEAHVVVCGEGRPAERELVAFCRRELAGFKVPRSFVFAETLPRTSSGKLQRGTLRAANAAPASLAACSPEEPAGRSGILAGEEGAVKLESEFTVERHRDEVVGIFDDDATFEAIMPDTRIVKREGDVRHTVTPYAAMGQSGEARFVFTTLVDGNLRFEKICDGNVWRALEGEVTLDEDGPFTRVALRMEGRTRALVPELAIRGPLREQLEQMADSLRRRLESA